MMRERLLLNLLLLSLGLSLLGLLSRNQLLLRLRRDRGLLDGLLLSWKGQSLSRRFDEVLRYEFSRVRARGGDELCGCAVGLHLRRWSRG